MPRRIFLMISTTALRCLVYQLDNQTTAPSIWTIIVRCRKIKGDSPKRMSLDSHWCRPRTWANIRKNPSIKPLVLSINSKTTLKWGRHILQESRTMRTKWWSMSMIVLRLNHPPKEKVTVGKLKLSVRSSVDVQARQAVKILSSISVWVRNRRLRIKIHHFKKLTSLETACSSSSSIRTWKSIRSSLNHPSSRSYRTCKSRRISAARSLTQSTLPRAVTETSMTLFKNSNWSKMAQKRKQRVRNCS